MTGPIARSSMRTYTVREQAARAFVLLCLALSCVACGDGPGKGTDVREERDLPTLEAALADPKALRNVCEQVGVPAPPPLETLDQESARAFYRALTEALKNPSDASRMGRLRMIYHAYDLPASAAEAYTIAAQRDATEFDWRYYHGTALVEQGQLPEAALEFRAAIQLRPAYAATYARLGDVYISLGDHEAARSMYVKLKDLRPDNPTGYWGLARIAQAEGDEEGALKLLEEAVNKRPLNAQIVYAFGMACRDVGDVEKARRYLDEASRMTRKPVLDDPLTFTLEALNTSVSAGQDRLEAALSRGQGREAVRIGEDLIRRAPEEYSIVVNLAEACRQTGDYARARELAGRATELSPTRPLAFSLLARLSAEQGDLESARGHMERALDLDAHSGDNWARLGAIHHALNNAQEATQCLKKSLKLDNDQPARWQMLTEIQVATGDYAGAAATLKRYMELYPHDEGARRKWQSIQNLLN